MNIIYAEGYEQAFVYARKAVQHMEERKISSTPSNFTVWYTYFSGANPQLVTVINNLIKSGVQFDRDLNEQIYIKYFTETEQNAEVFDAADQTNQVLSDLKSYLEESLKTTEGNTEDIQQFIGQMQNVGSMNDFKTVLGKLLKSTKKVVAENNALKNRIDESHHRIVDLKSNLDIIRKQSHTDALTGIANRKLFDVTLKSAVDTAANTKKALCLLMIDIDFFKKFNDTHGHVLGDHVLKLVAQTMSMHVKANPNYLTARYGGEEFSIILPDTPLHKAEQIANAFRIAIASKSIQNKKTGESFGKVTVSIGVAEYVAPEAPVDLIQRADRALYKAKKNGRNCVMVDDMKDGPIKDMMSA